MPNEQGRLDILKIHSRPIATHGEIDFESVVKLSDGFNGADLRNVSHYNMTHNNDDVINNVLIGLYRSGIIRNQG